jgi:hypothetical protein
VRRVAGSFGTTHRLLLTRYEHAAKTIRSKQKSGDSCTELGADYVQGGGWKRDKVQAAHDEWTITLDTYAVSTGNTVFISPD